MIKKSLSIKKVDKLFCMLFCLLILSGCASVDANRPLEEMHEALVDDMLQMVSDSTQEEAVVPLFLREDASTFAYDALTEPQKIWYRQIAYGLGDMEQTVKLDVSVLDQGITLEDIDLVFQCVMMDHPELFFVDGYTYTTYTRDDAITAILFSGTFHADREEVLRKNDEIARAAEPLLAAGRTLPDDYERIKYVYETIIQHTEYDVQAPDNQNIYSVLVNGYSVCQGYAKTTQYLLNRLGVECTIIQGTVENGVKHAWNLVRSDGSYYFVDTTWGDTSYQTDEVEQNPQDIPDINYDYLCIDAEHLSKTHTVDSMQIAIPDCTDDRDNYYVREDALFSSNDSQKLQRLFEKNRGSDRKYVSLRCTDALCYQELIDTLIYNQEIFCYLEEQQHISYSLNEDHLTMTFWVTKD